MAIENLPTSDESRLSGAYIRNLVKQLKTPNPTQQHTNNEHTLVTNDSILVESITCNKGNEMANKPKIQNAQGHKKQVRRRLHTSRPYQERLLNMAEARKEIVTALKFHRASMKQANEKKQQQQHQQQQHSILGVVPKIESLPSFNNNNVMVDNFSYYPSYNSNINNNNNKNCYNDNNPWVIPSLPLIETQNIQLPNQTLGLNLNLQSFANLSSNNLKYTSLSSPMMSSPSSSSSTVTPRDHLAQQVVPGVGQTAEAESTLLMDMHRCVDEDEMANIRSIGEQHQIEWDDTLDLVKSAWWFKFVQSVEFNNGNEFPTWLSANDQSFLQHHLEESFFEGTSLPWVDIGEIDGVDDEWLS
ncbi:hypothetical protein RND81_13G103500 [Saponaria officinalis]|uniref:Uncharacterized protein n=1 Tax=Saponaria officinalis TaxID=3572 RepID=A0AAW1H5K9_SAPOF